MRDFTPGFIFGLVFGAYFMLRVSIWAINNGKTIYQRKEPR